MNAITSVRESFHGMRPSVQKHHGRAGDIWKAAAENAVNHPGLTEKDPFLQARLQKLLARTIFLTGSSRMVFVRGMMEGEPGNSYVMPTISDEGFARLYGEQRAKNSLGDIGAFYSFAEKRKIGIIALKPVINFSDIDQRVIIAHELTHADQDFFDEPRPLPSSLITVTTSHEHIGSYARANGELMAYRTSTMVLNNETDGMFDQYVADLKDRTKVSIENGDYDVAFQPVDSCAELLDLKTAHATAMCQVLEQLHSEEALPTRALVGIMAMAGFLD